MMPPSQVRARPVRPDMPARSAGPGMPLRSRKTAGRGSSPISSSRGRWAFLFVLSLLFLTQPLQGQQELFERGNQLYQEEDFAGAVAAYQSILDSGLESADLYYNLGNAWFKAGELGEAVLAWERARLRAPDNADILSNLEHARSLTADAVEPLPQFWLFSALSWWVRLPSRGLLIVLVSIGWLLASGAGVVRILGRPVAIRPWVPWAAGTGGVLLLLFGSSFAVRELGLGSPERAIVMDSLVPVRSAPAQDDNLTLFEVHEGTRVRVDQRTGDWLEVVLDDGKVGWIPVSSIEVI